MPIMPGTLDLKTAQGEFDFVVDGGAVSTITLRSPKNLSTGNDIPASSVIMGGFIEVDAAFTSGGAATVAISAEAAGDIVAAAAVSGAPWSTTGRKTQIPVFTGATTVKTTAQRRLTLTIAAAALTAGAGRAVVFYR